MKLRLWAKIILPLVIIGVGFVGFQKMSSMRKFAKRKVVEKPAVAVHLESIQANGNQLTLHALGQLKPSRELSIQSEVSGKVVFLDQNVVPGGQLAEGQLLLKIDKRDYALAVSQRRAQLASARLQLKQEQGRKHIAEREWALMGGGVKASKDGKSLALRQPQIKNAKAAVRGAQSAVSAASLALKRTQISAPFNAVVRSEQVEVGQRVAPGQNIIRLVGTETWWVEVSLPISQLKYLKIPGSKAVVFQDDAHGAGRPGRVLRQLPDVERASQLARVIVEVKSPLDESKGARLLLGSAVKVQLMGTIDKATVRVPFSLLKNGNSLWTVDESGRLNVRTVNVIWRDMNYVLVTGVAAGTKVVKNHIPNATDGMRVRVIEDSLNEIAPEVATPERSPAKVSN
ncbi:MAG: efflux RND transporter periplasmic adaptor subunit [Myxococcota bacterium]|nr:efflux RND transporter periplasmic adaptor subunit [Myxococcota bacterium]